MSWLITSHHSLIIFVCVFLFCFVLFCLVMMRFIMMHVVDNATVSIDKMKLENSDSEAEIFGH